MVLSIVDVPELADRITSLLSLQDLASCILVDKTWNAAFVRYLWHTVPSPFGHLDAFRRPFQRNDAFFQILRNDYLSIRQQQECSAQNNTRCSLSSSSLLSRYGPWIRRLSLNQYCLQDVQQQVNTFIAEEPSTFQMESSGTPDDDTDITFASADTSDTFPAATLSTSTTTNAATTATVNNINQNAADSNPTAQELILHLLKHCPHLQSLELINWDGTDADLAFWKAIAADVVPCLVELCVSFNNRALTNPNPTTVSIPSIILANCSNKMQKLTIPYTNKSPQWLQPLDTNGEDTVEDEVDDGEGGQVDRGLADREEPLLGMKVLEFNCYEHHSALFMSTSFLKRCTNLETLHVGTLNDDWSKALRACTKLRRIKASSSDVSTVRLLTDILSTGGLLNLNDIEITYDDLDDNGVTDADTAALLSAGHKGWRNVDLSTLDTLTSVALIQHCATLESLKVRNTPGLTSDHIRQILSSSPRLHTFVTLDDGEYVVSRVGHISASSFIDLDSATNALRPWACEPTLKTFRAKILGIPRPDVTLTHYRLPRADIQGEQLLQEDHPGQGREIQGRVYERLSRFTRLEVLGLGHDDRDFGAEYDFVKDADGEYVLGDNDYQYDCLEMNLDSGLRRLGVLKELRELNVFRMATSIEVEDVEWMAMNWIKLEILDGLNTEANELDAETWLRENCPHINSNPCTFQF
ncbi:hypothetical protein BGZ95_003641 [Linnemannia exigua]|uniref:F-box domain-containing protein n=1 Tax=Linnemannia exigua TaxID=604196 RepID=A0AAD4D4B2_9FUNG|nr:hypothetical protein BGZ95_003641 [Linnemannia exigua]